MNLLSPKITYVENKKQADRHMEIVMSPAFHIAAQAAFSELALKLSIDTEGRDALASAKLEGARKFLEIFMNLGDVKAVPTDKSAIESLEPI